MSPIADIAMDGNAAVWWVTTISNTAAPTAAEISAGINLTSWITPDGWNVSTSDDSVDNTALNSIDNTALAGRRNDDISVTFKHQGDSSAPYTTFAGRPNGFLVERTSLLWSTSPTAAQKVRVFPVQAGSRAKAARAANELEKFTVTFFKSGAVVDLATVA